MDYLKKSDPLSSWIMFLFAFAAGLLVANLYYAQPLLAEISHDLHVGIENAGYLVTFVQIGYALGILFIVPLGDYKNRRDMVTIMLLLCVLSLLIVSVSPTFMILSLASILTGITSSATMVIIPYVASYSSEKLRGQRVGQVMTGLLLGILLARTVSGFVAHFFGWRSMYVIAAILIILLIFPLRKMMIADKKNKNVTSYGELLFSLGKLMKNEPEVRWRSWYALLALGSFSVLWTGLTFLLARPPYNYGTETIGLFGLIGVAGALSANIAGRLGDRGLARLMTGIFAICLSISWICLAEGKIHCLFLIIGIFIVDAAVQGLQVTHQSVLYRINSKANSRITSVFIASGFVGMSIGSALASEGYGKSGWRGVCIAGGGMALLLVISCLIQPLRQNKSAGARMSLK